MLHLLHHHFNLVIEGNVHDTYFSFLLVSYLERLEEVEYGQGFRRQLALGQHVLGLRDQGGRVGPVDSSHQLTGEFGRINQQRVLRQLQRLKYKVKFKVVRPDFHCSL